jgi:Peptidase family M28
LLTPFDIAVYEWTRTAFAQAWILDRPDFPFPKPHHNPEAIVREWLALQEHQLGPATFKKAKWTFETLLFPRLGDQPIAEIKAPDLLAALRKIEARGKYETTHRAKQRCGQVFRYAIATGRAEHESFNVIADWPGATHPEQVVIVSGHLDSWDLGTGAIDDGAGVAVAMQALHLMQKLGLHPARTIRFVAWMAEETGAEGLPPTPRTMRPNSVIMSARSRATWAAIIRPA